MHKVREELSTGVVIRLAARSRENDFSALEFVADASDFELNSEERERVKTGDGVGSISVWDEALTTAEQADAFLQPKLRIAFRIDVAEVVSLPFDLHIFRDPLDDRRPGAIGHCALEDVWRKDKQLRQQIRGRLAVIAGTGILLKQEG